MRVGALALGATLALGACAKRDNANSDTTSTTTSTTTPATGTSDTGAMAGANAGTSANAASMSDANLLSVISMANSNEIGTSKLAQTKATSASVKSYANDMVKDHTAMQAEADKVAKAINVTPEASAGVGDQMKAHASQESDSLKAAAKGSAFDMQYVNGQVADHQLVLDHLKQFQTSAQNAQVKDLVTKAIPKVQEHLDNAKKLQSQLGTRA
jgi:putative membrane protein